MWNSMWNSIIFHMKERNWCIYFWYEKFSKHHSIDRFNIEKIERERKREEKISKTKVSGTPLNQFQFKNLRYPNEYLKLQSKKKRSINNNSNNNSIDQHKRKITFKPYLR